MQVQCPCCQKTLSAPSEMLGKQVECPYCSVRFHVVSGDGGKSVSVSTDPIPPAQAPPTPPPAAPPAGGPPAATPSPSSPSIAASSAPPSPSPLGAAPARFKPLTASEDTAPSAAPPSTTSQSTLPPSTADTVPSTPKAVAPPPKTVDSSQRKTAAAPSRPVESRKSAPNSKSSTKSAAGSQLPPSTRSQPKKPAKQATFISADATQSRVHLGADGQLPQLVLQEPVAVDTKVEKTKTSNPWVMIGVLSLSFGLSVLMLFIDTTPGSGEAPTKAQTRRLIERSYIAQEPPLEEYQLLLRQALQAHTRGDTVRERRIYRRVLDMLHAEGKNKFKGLTGVPDADQPPNDRDLEELLSTMLAEDR